MEKKCYMGENAIWRKMSYGGKCHTEENAIRRKLSYGEKMSYGEKNVLWGEKVELLNCYDL